MTCLGDNCPRVIERDLALAQGADLQGQLDAARQRLGEIGDAEPVVRNAGSYLVFDAGDGRTVAMATIDGTATTDAHKVVDAVLHRLAERRAAVPETLCAECSAKCAELTCGVRT